MNSIVDGSIKKRVYTGLCNTSRLLASCHNTDSIRHTSFRTINTSIRANNTSLSPRGILPLRSILELVFRILELVFRILELVFRSRELLLRSRELLLRSCELVFRILELVFRSRELLLRSCELASRSRELLLRSRELLLRLLLQVVLLAFVVLRARLFPSAYHRCLRIQRTNREPLARSSPLPCVCAHRKTNFRSKIQT
jgi:hypothetical protein